MLKAIYTTVIIWENWEGKVEEEWENFYTYKIVSLNIIQKCTK